jgi:ADP-ribose pyrophosphatase
MKWKLLDRHAAYTGFFRLDVCQVKHDLYAGGEIEVRRELLHRGDAVAVLLYDPALDRVVMVEQFRIGALDDPDGPWLLEVVAGMIEADESVTDVARRECLEEAGLTVHAFEAVHSFYASPGGCSERVHMLCGLVDSNQATGTHGVHHEGEDIRVCVLDYAEIENMLHSQRITSAMPIIALQWLQLNRERLRIESFVL